MSCSCSSCSHHSNESQNSFLKKNGLVLIGIFIFSFAVIKDDFSLYLVSYLLIGFEIMKKSLKGLMKLSFLDENFLMLIATIGAFYIKDYKEAIAIILFYKIGEFFEERAVKKSRQDIKNLLSLKVDKALLKMGDNSKEVNVKNIKENDIIILKLGDMVSVDGVLLSKEAIFDTSSLTGEFKPKYVKQGGEVLSGYILKEGVAEVRATKSYKNSTIYKLIDLIENAALKKSKVEKFMTKFAKIYTPIVVLIAVLMTIIPVFIFKLNPDEWILKSVIFLAVSCPCALVLSIPLTFFNSIGIASKHGILIKGGNYLEGLNNIETIYFDKTGTLSEGAFEIIEIKPFNISEKEFLTKLEMVESLSNHPIAKAICKGCEEQKIDFTYYKEEQGLGIKASVKDKDYMVGSDKFLKLNNINFKEAETIGTKINLVINNEYKGYLVIGDNLKQGAKELVTTLKKDFGKNLIMLSGDNQENVEKVAKELGFDDYYGNLLPDEKLSKIKSKKSMFIGDGVNDAPSIMASSVGLSFSNFSSDITKEASDIVIVSGGLEKIKTLFLIAKHNKKVLTQNIAFVLLVKFLVLIMGSFGYVMIWHAIFADVGVSVLAVINSLKSFKLKEK